MLLRPTPRWLVGTAVLLLAVLAALLVRPGASSTGAAAPVGLTTATPAPSAPPAAATPPAAPPLPATPSPTAVRAAASAAPARPAARAVLPPLRPAAQPDLDVLPVLGPPPGPRADPRPARTAAPADRYALVVGVQDYRPPTVDTVGSAQDMRFIAARLVAAGWLPGNIRTLTDEQATGAAVRSGLDWLAAKGAPGTFALFHYSGHVKQLGGGREALWPVDRAFLDDAELTRRLAGVRGRLWVDVAGCEAASFLPGLPSERTLFSGSSKGTEKSYEYPPWRMSVWTGLLFDLGLRQGRADADGDRRTTVGEALRYAQYNAQVLTLGQRPHGRQTPQYAGAPDLGWTLADPPA